MSSNRRPLIAGNWKMNGLVSDGEALATALATKMTDAGNTDFDMLVCPPFTLVSTIGGVIGDTAISLGAQDCHTAEAGAHTGDISPQMLKDLGCEYVIVGHSERRTDHGETDESIRAKAEAAIAAGLKAVICIGETEAERNTSKTFDVVRTQVNGSVPANATAENSVVAYEPVWAIGTGRTPTNDEVQEVHALIRAELAGIMGAEAADGTRLLYGGSMKPSNAQALLALADVDGGLIGGASLKADDFWTIGECYS